MDGVPVQKQVSDAINSKDDLGEPIGTLKQGNKRTVTSRKTLYTVATDLGISIPRVRQGCFDLVLVPKLSRYLETSTRSSSQCMPAA